MKTSLYIRISTRLLFALIFSISLYSVAAQADELAERLAGFKPTRVLLEYSPKNDELMNERYQAYLAGEYELPTNEIYQLGFRIAKLAGNKRVYSLAAACRHNGLRYCERLG